MNALPFILRIRNEQEFDTLSHLDSIGLIQRATSGRFVEDKLPKIVTASYYDRHLRLEKPSDNYGDLDLGKVLLTKIGQELAPICGSKPVDGFYEYVKNWWRQYLPAAEKD